MVVALTGVAQWIVPACEPRGHWFDFQSGHMPGLWAQVPGRGCMRGNHTLIFLSFSFSLPSSLSKNK